MGVVSVIFESQELGTITPEFGIATVDELISVGARLDAMLVRKIIDKMRSIWPNYHTNPSVTNTFKHYAPKTTETFKISCKIDKVSESCRGWIIWIAIVTFMKLYPNFDS